MVGLARQKAFATAIESRDVGAVSELVASRPELVACVLTGAGRRNLGLSPLQVAIKSLAYDVVDVLLAAGADVNYIGEAAAPKGHAWFPVLNLALLAAERYLGGEQFPQLRRICAELLSRGADVSLEDSGGASALLRWLMLCESSNRQQAGWPSVVDDEEQLRTVAQMLMDAGSDPAAECSRGVSPLGFAHGKPALERILVAC